MANINEFTSAMESIRREIHSAKKRADKSDAVPFGLERLSKSSYAGARFKQMSKTERQEFIQRNGLQETMRMMQAGRGGTSAT